MTTTACPTIVQLAEISPQTDDLGGKALGLAQLQAMGLRVPAAWVIRAAVPDAMPEGLAEQVAALGDVPLAVRSSAQGEDGADTSFAGQYETVLNVTGLAAVEAAIRQCAESFYNERARAYRAEQGIDDAQQMNVVVQQMVDARSAGVVFTADPHSARRDVLVIDAVAGLGEALVSGEATPDHYAIDTTGDIIERQLVGEQPLLSDEEIATIAAQARQAAASEGCPLDLEWAIDQQGELFWLQARPITTLPADLNEFDTHLPRPDDVLTRSNIGEMMPGAVSPLTGSFTGWSIDYGCQHMQCAVGARDRIDRNWQITAWAWGHLFINLTGNVVMGAALFGSGADRTAQTLCGRPIPELKDLPPQPFLRRCLNMGKLALYIRGAQRAADELTERIHAFQIQPTADSVSMWSEIAGKTHVYEYAMAMHLQTSALSGFLSSIVENMVVGDGENDGEQQGEAVRLLAGAEDVESALMLDQLDTVIEAIVAHPEAPTRFQGVDSDQALAWLRGTDGLADLLQQFLTDHGHRGYRELCMRDPSWGDDPTALVQSMQASVQARLQGNPHRTTSVEEIDWQQLSRGLRWVLPKAHRAIRRREHTKSLLARTAHHFKRAFRHLGELLVKEGRLPDADLVYFFALEEFPDFIKQPSDHWVKIAQSRRDAFAYQQQIDLPDISVGLPRPLQLQVLDGDTDALVGRPASRGVVEGVVRVANTLGEAAALQAGEILITPITDIGWTPYFSMIAGLVTDLGSSVSHGAVIAREYGLPCVVNTRQATRFFQSGDRVRLDGDRGTVTLLSRA